MPGALREAAGRRGAGPQAWVLWGQGWLMRLHEAATRNARQKAFPDTPSGTGTRQKMGESPEGGPDGEGHRASQREGITQEGAWAKGGGRIAKSPAVAADGTQGREATAAAEQLQVLGGDRHVSYS